MSREHFHIVPEILPREIMHLIPAEIPDFMGSSDSAYELRSLYIQHKTWEVLNVRIFQPFLFTLDRQYGGVDTFLLTLSRNIRRKSERREAAWRQTTLRAAYTVSHAKQSINLVAAMIVEEILTEIKHFTLRMEWQALRTAVQRVVKSAAEVWRYARVEREMITAFMPDVIEDDQNDWFEVSEQQSQAQAPFPAPSKRAETMILRILPHIVRERVHTDFLGKESIPCIYLHGLALFSDSPTVIQCRHEAQGYLQETESPVLANNAASPDRHKNSWFGQQGLLDSPGSIRSWKSVGMK
jgi:hypothetical protein